MHLLAAQPGMVSDGTEPVDPAQDPADVIFLSAADTELAAVAAANQRLGNPGDFLRLAQLSWLAHPYSVDSYVDKTAIKSKLLVVRALGGLPYWSYALEQFSSRLCEIGVGFAALPGDDKPDEELFRLSNLSRRDWEWLLGYCVEGGPANAERMLELCRHLLSCADRPAPPSQLLRAGLYWPNLQTPEIADIRSGWTEGAPVAALVFYRALVQAGDLEVIDRLIVALAARNFNPMPIYVASLKDPVSAATLVALFDEAPPEIVLNSTSFAAGAPGFSSSDWKSTPLDSPGCPVLQTVLASCDKDSWQRAPNGLPAREIAMNISLPEVDGRILSRAVGFKSLARNDDATQCPISRYQPEQGRIDFVADLAANWVRLARTPAASRNIAILLANYPNKDGRLANGVGLDTPASAAKILHELVEAGYFVEEAPASGGQLMEAILAGPTNWLSDRQERVGGELLPLASYLDEYAGLAVEIREAVENCWGRPEEDPFLGEDGFSLSILRFGHAVVGIQPARGYNIDPAKAYHNPDLAPPHHYLAFYFWLRREFRAHAIVHLGKHGNLEWLPGKAVALSDTCFPEAAFGPLPNIYPFIVNDPGEGTQAKRRTQAAIIDHLTPPLARAETYGPLRELEILIDEYHEAAGTDPKRVRWLREKILGKMVDSKLDKDASIDPADHADSRLRKLDAYLCELKESQIRDGLHIFGQSPEGLLERGLVVALARLPRGNGTGENASFTRALSLDLGLGAQFDPLDCDMGCPWDGPSPSPLDSICTDSWRTRGDTVERLEMLANQIIEGRRKPPGPASAAVLENVRHRIQPSVAESGRSEIEHLLAALDGRFVPPGPSGAPTRGRPDVLPTGRNFYSVDSRSLPTRTAWELGWKSADMLIERHLQENGDWPRTIVVTAWGTSNMRTGGDDIAQALALMGVEPEWDDNSGRVSGFSIIPIGALGRPRVDVTLRISGFFRDAFPAQIDLMASAARAVMDLDEPEAKNPAAAAYKRDAAATTPDEAGYRVFGSKPGAYGAGLQALIDERIWNSRSDLGSAYVEWGKYAYGAGSGGKDAERAFTRRLAETEIVVQNQDNREHDILDSDDYYQFEGGAAAAVEHLSGRQPAVYHNDHSRPERPIIRTLEEEIGRVVRSRVVNPKWIDGVKRHGYKGAFELAATADYLFAFSATTGAVKSHHFDLVYDAFIRDDETRSFIAVHNRPALHEMAVRFAEAIDRNLWQPRLNSTRQMLAEMLGRGAVEQGSITNE